jgi:hypothetical protein
MKWYYLTLLPLMSFFFTKCFFANNKIVYNFEEWDPVLGKNAFKYDFHSTSDTALTTFLSLYLREEINTSEKAPLILNYYVSEGTPNVEKLKFIRIQLHPVKDGQVQPGINPVKNDFDISFSENEGKINKSSYSDSGKALNTLVDWNRVNYEYEFLGVKYIAKNKAVEFNGSTVFEIPEYPEKIKVIVTFIWETQEKKIEVIMSKEKYEKQKQHWDLKY